MSSLLEIKHELQEYIQKEKDTPARPDNFIITNSVYSSLERYEQESTALENFPKILGPLTEVKKLKEFIVSETESTFKVFYNSCPHRGARLESNPASDHLTCPYHGWTFDKEGQLLKSTGHNCPFPKGALKLRELKNHVVGGMIFTGDSSQMDSGFHQEIQSFSKKAKYLTSKNYEVACNWKFLVESLLETYHFPFAHDTFLAGFNNAFFSLGTSSGFDSRIVVPLENFDETRSIDGFDGINVMYFLFPYSFVLFMSAGYVWFKIDPLGKDQCRFTFSLFSYHDDLDEVARKSFVVLEKILNQDFVILEGQQQNTVHNQRNHFTGYEKLIKQMHKNLNELIAER
ncbi:SRPBCC family protein [Bacteriovorax sp. PP10]|uniref:SRPBCC family protein n=1 Tax=Bacteriovorax antarcticus TaxID=3088717 RepID=A0ABU5VXC7_9BACT|nr:SRPBCC family protein [Bacteriovorax sp. PP10]MEA9357597.1 SRPBCC family protein [Bacteriovorax sp. PP10]